LLIIGTSSVYLTNSKKQYDIPGIFAYVKNGIVPGYYIYELGQAGCGDNFDWFVKNCVPAAYQAEAEEKSISIHALLREKACRLLPGESGLLALDWWNGSRSPLKNDRLSGNILGLTLTTKPEEIYRALLEATAYGTRMIIENYRAHGVEVNEFYATGGIARKDPLMMQIYADVLRMPVHVVGSQQGPALGSAMYAAVAAGEEKGGYADIASAVRALAPKQTVLYTPVEENAAVYDVLFEEYRRLHDYFGRGGADTMKTLKKLRA
jgi:L-ribulokinase